MQIDTDYKKFVRDGYLHIPSLIPIKQCDALLKGFESEVKDFNSPLLRQDHIAFETHRLSPKGLMENSLLDVHRINSSYFPHFVHSVYDITGNTNLLAYINKMIGFDNALVQTSYFEGSNGTKAHFDKHFLAAEESDPIIGAWIALEDIHESAGRFFIYPQSHHDSSIPESNKKDVYRLLEEYKKVHSNLLSSNEKNTHQEEVNNTANECENIINEIITLAGWKKLAPSMKKGDTIFFSSSILHGSDAPTEDQKSRHSLTAHFINTTRRKIRFGTYTEELKIINTHGLQMHHSERYNQYPLAS